VGRRDSIAGNARSFLDAEESVEAIALVKGPLSNYALVATGRNVYALKLGGLGYSKVKEVTMKIPLADLVLNETPNGFAIGRLGTDEKHGWGKMPFQSVDEFVAYVREGAKGTD
jgi:hypothetical protein